MRNRRTSLRDNYKYCLACGHGNPPWRNNCERCKTELEDLPEEMGAEPRERPGCVTIYAILLAISALITIGGGILLGFGGSMLRQYFNEALASQQFNPELLKQGWNSAFLNQIMSIIIPGILVFTFLAGMVNLLIAWGLWWLKNWARILVIVFQALGLLGNIFSMITTLLAPSSAYSEFATTSSYGTICMTLVSFIIGGYIIFWFGTNGDYFR